jgi:16S rRNA (adenine1518-N6/adenine1519-N6)-dimethyltransferase
LQKPTFTVIDQAFLQRRKTLRQALAGWAGSPAEAEQILVRAGIDPQARGEQLNIEQFIAIASAK